MFHYHCFLIQVFSVKFFYGLFHTDLDKIKSYPTFLHTLDGFWTGIFISQCICFFFDKALYEEKENDNP